MFVINNEWLYHHIPKTSGTNLKNRFLNSKNSITEDYDLRWSLYQQWYNHSQIKDSKVVLLGWYVLSRHMPLFVWEDKINEKNLKIFATIRNPYTWIVSSYNRFLEVLSSKSFLKIDKNVAFKDFYFHSQIIQLRESFPFNQTITQSDFLKTSQSEVRCDKIYKMETDLLDLEKDFSLTDLNKYKYNTLNYNKNYSELYDKKMIDWVQETYQEDFCNFGYALDPFWM
jgi:hypothetical protein